MKATPECLECVGAQALRAAQVATSDAEIQNRIVSDTTRRIPGMDMAKSPAELSLIAYELTAAYSGKKDPYLELKQAQNEFALSLEPELREIVANSNDPLSAALHLAAAGNIIDLGVQHAGEVDVRGAIEQVFRESFAIDHSAAFRKSLESCKDLVYLLDNAGEIVFDKILIEELMKHTQVTAVVKSAPIINDVLMEDAEQVGLTEICWIIDNGGGFVGCPLNLVSRAFLERIARADIILGKGQGNYETMDVYDGNVFLLLRAKCDIIARDMGVKFGQVAFISTRERNAGR